MAMDQTFSRVPGSETAPEESLSVYCKPVELYEILQRRAHNKPLYLQRSLLYSDKRITVSVSVRGAGCNGLGSQSIFPVYVVLARKVTQNVETSGLYHFKQACKLTAFYGADDASSSQARFVLPEINKLSSEIESGSISMLMVSFANSTDPLGIDLTEDHMFSPESDIDCYCLLGKIPIDFLRLGKKVEMMPTVCMNSWILKVCTLDEERCLSFQLPFSSESVELPITISAKQLGAEEKFSPRVDSPSNIPPSNLPRDISERPGNVVFNYKYYNDTMQITEVTKDYRCPFCMVKCTSYKGLKHHLPSSHDLFRFQFWSHGDIQFVDVAVKPERSTSETGVNLDPRVQDVYFCRKPLRRMPHTENAVCVVPPSLDFYLPATTSDERGVVITEQQSAPENRVAPQQSQSQQLVQFDEPRHLPVVPRDPNNRVLLLRRQFFHSQRAQPMALEQVFGEEDSEDDVDDHVLDLEAKLPIYEFSDITLEEKEIMHKWSIFLRKQRVLADAHTPWACEAFSKSNVEDLTKSQKILLFWRVFMVKLWNQGLLDWKTMNKCNKMLEEYKKQKQQQIVATNGET